MLLRMFVLIENLVHSLHEIGEKIGKPFLIFSAFIAVVHAETMNEPIIRQGRVKAFMGNHSDSEISFVEKHDPEEIFTFGSYPDERGKLP